MGFAFAVTVRRLQDGGHSMLWVAISWVANLALNVSLFASDEWTTFQATANPEDLIAVLTLPQVALLGTVTTITGLVTIVFCPEDFTDEKSFSKYRPGHADYAGSIKYNQTDLRNILERSSARKTAIEVAVGAVAKLMLKQFEITCSSKIIQIGNGKTEEEFHKEIDKAKEIGDTLGGKFEIVYENLPVGLGSYVHWDRMLDGKIAQAIMSIPAVKAVSIGNNNAYKMLGSEFHDQMYLKDGKIVRKTNNAGGIEGGMTNGEPLVVTAIMKPIPTLRKPLNTVDAKTMEQTEAHFERSDTCAVEACSVVAENRIACVLIDEILMKFGGDNLTEVLRT